MTVPPDRPVTNGAARNCDLLALAGAADGVAGEPRLGC